MFFKLNQQYNFTMCVCVCIYIYIYIYMCINAALLSKSFRPQTLNDTGQNYPNDAFLYKGILICKLINIMLYHVSRANSFQP